MKDCRNGHHYLGQAAIPASGVPQRWPERILRISPSRYRNGNPREFYGAIGRRIGQRIAVGGGGETAALGKPKTRISLGITLLREAVAPLMNGGPQAARSSTRIKLLAGKGFLKYVSQYSSTLLRLPVQELFCR